MDGCLGDDRLHLRTDEANLVVKPVDELRFVTASDRELRLTEQRTADSDLALVSLRVDHPDAGWRDGDVVDVCATAGDPPVMQDDDALRQRFRQRRRDALLAAGTTSPDLLMSWLVLKDEERAADARMAVADATLAVRLSSLVLMTSTRAGSSQVDVVTVVRGAHSSTLRRARTTPLAPAQALGRSATRYNMRMAITGLRRTGEAQPVGALADGTEYYAPIGELVYDGEDRVVCHLCGRAMRMVGGTHLRVGHGWTLEQYREAFHLPSHAPTCSHDLSDGYRERAVERLDAEDRFGRPPKPRQGPKPARSPRWRSLAERHPDLVAELSPRNEDFDPATVGAGSRRRPWWRCGECGHEWQATVANRTLRGSGCPVCGVRSRAELRSRVEPERSLLVVRPDLAGELDPDRNEQVDLSTLAAASARKVWWRCAECGHTWEATVASRWPAQPGARRAGNADAGPHSAPSRRSAHSRDALPRSLQSFTPHATRPS